MESSSEKSYLFHLSVPIISSLFQELESCLSFFTFQLTLHMRPRVNPWRLTLNQTLHLLQAMPSFPINFTTKYNPLAWCSRSFINSFLFSPLASSLIISTCMLYYKYQQMPKVEKVILAWWISKSKRSEQLILLMGSQKASMKRYLHCILKNKLIVAKQGRVNVTGWIT